MGDYSAIEVTVYGVAGHEQDLADFFCDGWSIEWADEVAPERITDGTTLTDDQRSLGTIMDEIEGSDLEAWGISYWATQSARYEYTAYTRMWTPELGSWDGASADDGEPMVYATSIDKVIELANDMAMHDAELWRRSVVQRLDRLSGKEHREAFKALRDATREKVEP